MGQIDVFTTNVGDETENANTVKNTVLERLYEDDIIDEDTLREYKENHHMIIGKYAWYSTWIQKLKSLGKDIDTGSYFYKFVKF